MGLLDSIKNKLDEISDKEVMPLILPEEVIELKFKAVEDVAVFTDKRILIVDRKFGDGNEYVSIPYSKISTVFIKKPGIGLLQFREIGVISGSFKHEFKAPGDGLEVYQFLLRKIS